MKKNLLRVTGYLLFAITLYTIFLLALFPFNSLIPLITGKIKESTGLNLRIQSLRPGLPCTLSVTGLTLLSDTEEEIYGVQNVTLSLGLISLLRLSPEINYLITDKGASLRGSVYSSDEKYLKVDASLISLSPGELLSPFKNPDLFTITGKVELAGTLKILLDTLRMKRFNIDSIERADFNLTIKDMGISLPQIPLKKLSEFSFSKIEGNLSMERGQVKIDLGDILGDIDGSLKGKIMMMNPLLQSRLDLRLKFRPSKALITRAGDFLSILSRRKGTDGVFTVDLKGTFLNPRPII